MGRAGRDPEEEEAERVPEVKAEFEVFAMLGAESVA